MIPTTNLTAAKIRRMFLVTALVICPILAFQSGHAQATATATLTSGGNNSITVNQNGQFVLSLGVTTNFETSGYTVFYQSNNGSGFFRLISRQNTSPIYNDPDKGPRPIFNDPTTPSSQAFAGDAGLLNPTNDFDLGYTGDSFNNQPAGTFSLQNITINVLNAPIGSYTIFLDSRSIMTNRATFTDVPMGGVDGPQFTVNVVPEPATVGLAVMGGGLLLVAAWRKRRTRA